MRLSAILLLACNLALPAFAAKQYSYYRVGNANDVTTSTTGGWKAEAPMSMPRINGCAR